MQMSDHGRYRLYNVFYKNGKIVKKRIKNNLDYVKTSRYYSEKAKASEQKTKFYREKEKEQKEIERSTSKLAKKYIEEANK